MGAKTIVIEEITNPDEFGKDKEIIEEIEDLKDFYRSDIYTEVIRLTFLTEKINSLVSIHI